MNQSMGRFYIKSKKASKYITISRKGQTPKVVLYQKDPSQSQVFELNIRNDYFIQIIDTKTKQCLTLEQCSDRNGAPLILKEKNQNNQKGQQFQLHSTQKQGEEIILFTFCGKCLDCCQQATSNGTQIIQWDFHGSSNQKWILEKV